MLDEFFGQWIVLYYQKNVEYMCHNGDLLTCFIKNKTKMTFCYLNIHHRNSYMKHNIKL
jgi:hypothetical protein